MNYRFFSLAVTLLVVLQSHISGAVIFEDDFSNDVTSYQNWVSSNSDFNTLNFVDGSCKVENTSTTYTAYVSNQLSLPSTFTYSCTITRSAGTANAGIVFYFSTSDNYSVISSDNYIFIMKPGETTAPSISCPYLNAESNKITVSHKDTVYNIFINDQFAATFSDDKTRSGGIGFINYPGASVIYDDVVVTDQFLEGTVRTCYSDSFDDSTLKFWEVMEKKSTKSVENGKLSIVTEDSDSAHCFLTTNLKLTNFVIRVEVSHVDGSEQSIYGLRLYDSSYSRTAAFVINGERTFGSSLDNNSLEMSVSTKIFGKSTVIGEQLYVFTDTLQVIKPANSANYFFVVNNDTLDTLTGIDFEIANVGFFCQKGLTLEFDNFVAAEGDSAGCSSSIRLKNRYLKDFSIRQAGSIKICDVLGRSIPAGRLRSSDLYHRGSMASGIYVNNVSNKSIMKIK